MKEIFTNKGHFMVADESDEHIIVPTQEALINPGQVRRESDDNDVVTEMLNRKIETPAIETNQRPMPPTGVTFKQK